VPGLDGEKMSKSYGNTIDLFEDAKAAKKKIMGIKTDSTPVADPKDPAKCNVFALLRLFTDPAETAEWDKRYRAGGMGYGEAKKRLAELFEAKFGPARERRAQLVKDAAYVEDVLAAGGRKARAVAQAVMEDVRAACGIVVAKGRSC
jgi:tryptophanyl-tRNA synthetase